MPLKITTETDLLRLLSNSPLQIEIYFMKIKGHEPKNTPASHMKEFYSDFEELKSNKYDGMIITGAPVEQLPFDEVDYWSEMTQILDWAEHHVTSTLYICWAAQAGLFHHYGIPKYPLNRKKFGVFKHRHSNNNLPIFRGFDDEFFVPHSRHTEIKSDEAGVCIVMAKNGKQLFITGHSEYSRNTLDGEYKRDKSKNLPIDLPINYYPGNDESKNPVMRWQSTANLFFSNWLNYYVYQETPYNLEEIQ